MPPLIFFILAVAIIGIAALTYLEDQAQKKTAEVLRQIEGSATDDSSQGRPHA